MGTSVNIYILPSVTNKKQDIFDPKKERVPDELPVASDSAVRSGVNQPCLCDKVAGNLRSKRHMFEGNIMPFGPWKINGWNPNMEVNGR